MTALRLDYDLVTRGDIASRLDVTKQAVGNWIREDRRKGHPFPPPFSDVSNGIWLWGDVLTWIRKTANTPDPEEGIEYPTRAQTAEVNACINSKFTGPHSKGSTVFHFDPQRTQHKSDHRHVDIHLKLAFLHAVETKMNLVVEPQVHNKRELQR